MALRFRVERTLSTSRIAVLRASEDKGGKEKLQLIGSFGQRKSPDLLRDKLTEDEQYELDNYLSTIEFAQRYFGVEVHELDRFLIKVAPSFQIALRKLWKFAKQYDLEFIPEKEMFYCLFNKAKNIERKINEITGKRIKVLEELKIDIDEIVESHGVDLESKKLFQALLELNLPEKQLCQEFQEIVKQNYKKNTEFKPHFFHYYADIKNLKPFPKWYFSVAIDLLLQHGINPIKLISPEKVTNYWVRSKIQTLSIEKAKDLFVKTFSPAKSNQKRCFEVIDARYLKEKIK